MDKIKFFNQFYPAFFGTFLSVIAASGISFAAPVPLHHDLTVDLDPHRKFAKIQDKLTIHLEEEKKTFILELFLHANFWLGEIKIPDNKSFIIETTRSLDASGDVPLTKISIRKITDGPWPENLNIEFKYEGGIFDPQNPENAETSGEGIFLSGASYFYPQTLKQKGTPDTMTFRLAALHPKGWKVVSQGQKTAQTKNGKRVVWETIHPMEEIFAIANRFEEYEKPHGDILFHAYLFKKDHDLAEKYFSAAKKYLDFYEKLIGPYPYPKFALIENSRETGLGMASFTFLGSRIIRFPFILDSSYPHEILHNWWGNGVYIDPESGNWAEGLTSYLSDHLLMELKGKGGRYRLQQLMKFLNHVNKSNDFPLIEFKSRAGQASQAIGYGKALMTLHMVRLQVGNDVFLKALREFHREFQFRFAGLGDLRRAFESASEMDLSGFFDHWIYRRGAPVLELSSAKHAPSQGGHQLRIEIKQTQSGPAFPFSLPVAVWTKGSSVPQITLLNMTEKTLAHSFDLSNEPGQVQIDPYTEVFRKLDRREVPPSIGQTYGYPLPARILPGREKYPDVLLGYHQFAMSLAENSVTSGSLMDDEKLSPIPKGGLWVFGGKNLYGKRLKPQLRSYGVKLLQDHVIIRGKSFPRKDRSFVFTVPRPDGLEGSVTWVIASSGESVSGLIRKLPHYGKYGVLVFKGNEPENLLKRVWPFNPSSLMKSFHPGDYSLPPQPPLVDHQPN